MKAVEVIEAVVVNDKASGFGGHQGTLGNNEHRITMWFDGTVLSIHSPNLITLVPASNIKFLTLAQEQSEDGIRQAN